MAESAELKTVYVQRTPLDQRVRDMDAIRMEGTNNMPVVPVPDPAPKRKLYLAQTEMKHNL